MRIADRVARIGAQIARLIAYEYANIPGATMDEVIAEAEGALAAAGRAFDPEKGQFTACAAPATGQYCRLFNPRIDRWTEHFFLEGLQIVGKTDVAQVTIKILRLSDQERVVERELLQQIGEYPT